MTPFLLLIGHCAITFAMTGIIWFVHLIHYPIIQRMEQQETALLANLHWDKTLRLAIILLSLELASGCMLLVYPPFGVEIYQIILGLVLMGAIWLTTWGVCVPQHCQLKKSGSPEAASVLMKANEIRSILWTLRSLVVLSMLNSAMIA